MQHWILLFFATPFSAIGIVISPSDQHLIESQVVQGDRTSPMHDDSYEDVQSTPDEDGKAVVIGALCNANGFPEPAPSPYGFYSCERPTNLNWPWLHLGLWKLKDCENDTIFSLKQRKCIPIKKIRRSDPCSFPGCQPPAPPIIALPCPTASDSHMCAGCPCSWMLAPMIPFPGTSGYLQCAPAYAGVFCGVWTPMPCAPGTRFDLETQVCVHAECVHPCGAGPEGIPYAAARRRPTDTPEQEIETFKSNENTEEDTWGWDHPHAEKMFYLGAEIPYQEPLDFSRLRNWEVIRPVRRNRRWRSGKISDRAEYLLSDYSRR